MSASYCRTHDNIYRSLDTMNHDSIADTPVAQTQATEIGIGGTVREYLWKWKGKSVTIVYEVRGEGVPILLLPAFSTVSSRTELRGLADLLSPNYQVVAIDWVGFGQSDRPAIHYSPAVYHALLRDFVQAVFSEPIVVMAAGHAAGYVMQLAQKQPAPWSWVVLAAPTWRGPLPTAMGERRWLYRLLRNLVNLPVVGQFLYLLTTTPAFLGLMYRRHVFAEASHVTRRLIRQKWRSTQRRRARLASAAFVTGGLDPIQTREQWFAWFQPLPVPVLMAIGEQTPPKSRAEMEVLAHFSSAQVLRMPGSLGLHEEYAATLVAGLLPFLEKYLS